MTTATRPVLAQTTAASLTSARLPENVASAVRRALADGEVIRWLGQPVPSLLARRHRLKPILGVPWTVFFVALMVGLLRDSGAPALLISPFIFIGLCITFAPLVAAGAARQSVYVVTDRRALVVSKGELGGYGWPAFRLQVRWYDPAALRDVRHIDKGAGSHDLIFRTRVEENDGAREVIDEGFVGLDGKAADAAEAALTALGGWPR